jgi:hypothetical protein
MKAPQIAGLFHLAAKPAFQPQNMLSEPGNSLGQVSA